MCFGFRIQGCGSHQAWTPIVQEDGPCARPWSRVAFLFEAWKAELAEIAGHYCLKPEVTQNGDKAAHNYGPFAFQRYAGFVFGVLLGGRIQLPFEDQFALSYRDLKPEARGARTLRGQ